MWLNTLVFLCLQSVLGFVRIKFRIPDISEALTNKKIETVEEPVVNTFTQEEVVGSKVATDEDADLLELLDEDQ